MKQRNVKEKLIESIRGLKDPKHAVLIFRDADEGRVETVNASLGEICICKAMLEATIQDALGKSEDYEVQ